MSSHRSIKRSKVKEQQVYDLARSLCNNRTKMYGYCTGHTRHLLGFMKTLLDRLASGAEPSSIIRADLEKITTENLSVLEDSQCKRNRKLDHIQNLMKEHIRRFGPITIESIIDIGCSDAKILERLGDLWAVSKQGRYALDVVPVKNKLVTVVTYNKDGTIPLRDKSVDVVVLYSVLHHIQPIHRAIVLREIKRILTHSGVILIREHNCTEDNEYFRHYLTIMHWMWEIGLGEAHQEIYPFSLTQLQTELSQAGLRSDQIIEIDPRNPNHQRLYEMTVTHSHTAA
jgi:SAM-dependent methyltransferase